MEPIAQERHHRLFFALLPEERQRLEIGRVAGGLAVAHPARLVPEDRWHVTLAFLGQIPGRSLACLQRAAASVRGAPFDLVLDRTGHWKKAQVFWLGARTSPPELLDLVNGLRAGLGACEIAADDRPFQPHMTLARRLRRRPPPLEIEPIAWRVSHFHLMESMAATGGVGYRAVGTWELGAGAPERV